MSGLLKEYRVTVTTVSEQYEYVVDAATKADATALATVQAQSDGWKPWIGNVTVERLS